MPRRATRPGPPTLLLGVWGQGDSSPENIAALLDDFIDGAGNVTPKFLVPLDKELSSDAVLDTARYAIEKGYDVEVVYQEKPKTKVLKEICEAAVKEHQFEETVDDDRFETTEDAIADNFTVLLAEKDDNARLLFLWFEDADGEPDEDDQRLLAAVADCGVVALDLSQGLEVLDVAPAEDEPAAEPEPEKPAAKKTTATKKTAAAKEEPEPEPEGDDDEPDRATVGDWPIRRIRSYAKQAAQAEREDGNEAPDDSEFDEMGKDVLLGWLFPDEGDEPEPEPAPAKKTAAKKTTARETKRTEDDPPAEDAPVSRRRATQIREDIEEDGGSKQKVARKAAAAAEEAQDEPEDAGEGDDTSDAALERFKDALAELSVAIRDDDTEAEDAGWVAFADAFADIVIERIAARVEKEPENSAVRKEIAPPRPPGKPRKDGATPTRRRTARGR